MAKCSKSKKLGLHLVYLKMVRKTKGSNKKNTVNEGRPVYLHGSEKKSIGGGGAIPETAALHDMFIVMSCNESIQETRLKSENEPGNIFIGRSRSDIVSSLWLVT